MMLVSKRVSLSAVVTPYKNPKGKDIWEVTLKNDKITIGITNLGCAITSIYTPDRNDVQKNIVAGFTDIMEYEKNEHYFGCIVGRYANRIAGGKFLINDNCYQLSVNDGVNHLHGGFEGFHQKLWKLGTVIQNETEAGVVFEYLSKDGEEGYPGNLEVKVKYLLNQKNQFCIHYTAKTDKSTPVNLTNHSYFNLTGFETPEILDHILQINAAYCTPKNEINTPTGHIESVEGTPLNFLEPKTIRQDIDQLAVDKGYDHNYVLLRRYAGELVMAAELSELQTGRIVRVFTDKPAMQLYTGNLWDGGIIGQQNLPYLMHGGVALETQAFPDSPNQPGFPDTILHPGAMYQSSTIYEFAVK